MRLTKEKIPRIGRDIILLAGSTTLITSTSLTIDAFNPPKFALLVSGITFLTLRYWKQISQGLAHKSILIPFVTLLAIYFALLFAHPYSISERIFGIAGRNFGFITLVAFAFMCLFSLEATRSNFLTAKTILSGLAFTNIGVSLTFILQQQGLVFTNFQNEYQVLPSTLGNPNFLSAFLGFSTLGVIFWTFQNRNKILILIIGPVAFIVSICIIFVSNSIQGFVSLAISLMVLILIFSFTFLPNSLNFFGLAILGLSSLVIAFGFLNFGPLGERLEQRTLSNRVTYWEIAMRMIRSSPLIGKGYDSYLDHFRGVLKIEDVENLGEGVISDSPHSIFLDFFVSGGLVLGIAQMFFLLLATLYGFKSIKGDVNSQKIDLAKASLYSVFLSQIAICAISPFQIGIFVWLPIIVGNLIALKSFKLEKFKYKFLTSQRIMSNLASIVLFVALLLCNFVVSFLPLVTENRFRVAVEQGSFQKLKDVALDWPFSGSRAIAIAEGFMNSSRNPSIKSDDKKVFDQLEMIQGTAMEIALATIEINELQFEGWRFVFQNSPDVVMRERARQKLQRLDPTNLQWRASQ